MSKIMDHVGRDDDYRLILLTAKYVISDATEQDDMVLMKTCQKLWIMLVWMMIIV